MSLSFGPNVCYPVDCSWPTPALGFISPLASSLDLRTSSVNHYSVAGQSICFPWAISAEHLKDSARSLHLRGPNRALAANGVPASGRRLTFCPARPGARSSGKAYAKGLVLLSV